MKKKSSAKPVRPPAKASKPAAKAAAKPAAPAKKPTLPSKAAAMKGPLPSVASAKEGPAKKTGPKLVSTTISAQVDVGFGNTLYIRGEGPGLDWDKGIPMACVSDDRWSVSLHNASRPVTCKFLINDLIWCSGDDFSVTPGTSVSFVPLF